MPSHDSMRTRRLVRLRHCFGNDRPTRRKRRAEWPVLRPSVCVREGSQTYKALLRTFSCAICVASHPPFWSIAVMGISGILPTFDVSKHKRLKRHADVFGIAPRAINYRWLCCQGKGHGAIPRLDVSHYTKFPRSRVRPVKNSWIRRHSLVATGRGRAPYHRDQKQKGQLVHFMFFERSNFTRNAAEPSISFLSVRRPSFISARAGMKSRS